MRKSKRIAVDRLQQVATTRARYGDKHYEIIGAMSATFLDRRIAKKAILKRWHPDWFSEDGNMLPQYEKELDRENKRKK